MNYKVTISTTTPETLVFHVDTLDAISATLTAIRVNDVNQTIINSCVAEPE